MEGGGRRGTLSACGTALGRAPRRRLRGAEQHRRTGAKTEDEEDGRRRRRRKKKTKKEKRTMKKTEDTRLRDCRKCPLSGLTSHCWGIFPSTFNRRRQAEPAGARKAHSATVLGSRKSSARLRAFRDLGSSGRLGSEGAPRAASTGRPLGRLLGQRGELGRLGRSARSVAAAVAPQSLGSARSPHAA